MEKNKLAMLLFISSEAIFFILLILAYVILHNNVQPGQPTAASSLDPLKTGFFSLFLFSSSFTIWRAEKGMAAGNGRFSLWLALTIVLGIVFIFGQGLEWAGLIGQGTTVSTNTFGTTFFTMTGFHGIHVIVGLIGLSIILGMAARGGYRSSESPSFAAMSYYWHFVDAVWIVIYSIVYLTIL